ncbi:MAG TPA: two-component regulator propeller domain-containing protein [Bdellovibrionota bacterium]|nr:two-component regulator propeller domain-containing protein [Bdellovibrionota bacterium]
MISGVQPGDEVYLWPNGPTYLPGGPQLNAIQEPVLYWSRRFPSVVHDIVRTYSGLYLAARDGLYFLANEDLTKSPRSIYPIKYTVADGLPSYNIVYNLADDGQGGLWLIVYPWTLAHLTFDGGKARFETVPVTATSMVADQPGSLWVGTAYGICHVTIQNGAIGNECYSFLNGDYVDTLALDQSGGFWIGTVHGLFHFRIENNLPQVTSYEQYFSQVIKHLAVPTDGAVWIGTDSGLGRLLINNSTVDARFFTSNDGLLNNRIESLNVDRNGELWIGTASGPMQVVVQQNQFQFLSMFLGTPLQWQTILSFEFDETGGVWAGTWWSGLFFVDPVTSSVVQFDMNEPLQSNDIQAVMADDNGAWIGTSLGLARLQISNGESYFESSIPPVFGAIRTFVSDQAGGFWAGGDIGLYHLRLVDGRYVTEYFSAQNGLPSNDITTIVEDALGGVWIGTSAGLSHGIYANGETTFSNFDTQNSPLSDNRIFSLARGLQDDLWIGTYDGSLTHFSWNSSGGLETRVYTTSDGMPDERFGLTSLLVTKEGTVWIGTWSRGLVRLAFENGIAQFKTFTMQDGLSFFQISALADDGKGGIWIGTTYGMSHMTLDMSGAPLFKNYLVADGLPSLRINSFALSPNGGIFIATDNGFVLFPNSAY